MFFTKLRKSGLNLSSLESFVYMSGIIALNIYAFYDDQDHTAISKMLAGTHTLATLIKIRDNFNRSSCDEPDTKVFKTVTGASSLAAIGTLVGTCLLDQPKYNLICAVSNAGINFFSRTISSAYRKNVDDIIFDQNDSKSMGDDDSTLDFNYRRMDANV